ncbi:MAG: hypothetical protein WBN57_12205 [Gammaproteobacteria bacterium]
MITERNPSTILIIILCILVVIVLYMGAADFDVTGSDESRTTGIAREMNQHSDYLLPSLRNGVTAESLTKSALLHWVMIASASPFDRDDFSLRISGTLSAILCLLLVFRLASRMFDDHAGADILNWKRPPISTIDDVGSYGQLMMMVV